MLHVKQDSSSGLQADLSNHLTSEYPEKSLIQSGVSGGTDVFLWNGKEVEVSL